MEIWKILARNKNYEVSNHGQIRSLRFKKPIKLQFNNCGYARVQLSYAGNRFFIHRLVAETFCPPFKGETVNHLNGDKADNRASNLKWVSQSENDKHAYSTGLKVPIAGQKHGMSKLTEDDVKNILSLKGEKNSVEIGALFGVNPRTIRDILNGVTWKHLHG